MGDGERAAGGELPLEEWHHRAGRSQHVAEANGDEARAPRLGAFDHIERLAIALGEPLCGAHDVRRVDRLVGRDENHRGGARLACRLGDIAGSDRVGERAFGRVRLDDRHVLQGRGMKDKIGPLLGEQRVDTPAVAHVGEFGAPRDPAMAFAELEIDRVEIELRAVDENQARRCELGDLADEFAADRAAGAGDEDPPPGDEIAHRLTVEHRLRPAEQILDRDRPYFDSIGLGGAKFGQARQAGDAEALAIGHVKQRSEPGAAEIRVRHDKALRAGPPRIETGEDRRQLVERAKHVDAANVAADPRRAVVDDADHPVVGPALALGRLDEHLGLIAGADEQHRNAPIGRPVIHQIEAPILEQPIEHAGASEQAHEDEPVDEYQRARQIVEPGDQK